MEAAEAEDNQGLPCEIREAGEFRSQRRSDEMKFCSMA